ncbi:MAG: hypothetical protein LBQ31_00900 [Bacteroidales bacterium]|nr:hypothetical protein [Bacteroidales bacterium]
MLLLFVMSVFCAGTLLAQKTTQKTSKTILTKSVPETSEMDKISAKTKNAALIQRAERISLYLIRLTTEQEVKTLKMMVV